MSRFDVHTRMRGQQTADARAEMVLEGGSGDPVLSSFVTEVRSLATSEAPAPTGDLAVLLADGFVPEPTTVAPPLRLTVPVRRWLSRGAVVASPFAWKLAAAATAAAATAGGMAAAGALPDAAQRWASDAASVLHIDIPNPDDATPLESMGPLFVPKGAPTGPRPAPASGSSDSDTPSRPDAYEGGEEERERAEQRAEDDAEAAEEQAERDAEAAEDEADAREDSADDDADAREDRADDDADAAEDVQDESDDAAEEAAEQQARRAREQAEAAEESAEQAEDEAESVADDAEEFNTDQDADGD